MLEDGPKATLREVAVQQVRRGQREAISTFEGELVENEVVAVLTGTRSERHRHAQRTAERHAQPYGGGRIAEDVVHLLQYPVLQFGRPSIVIFQVMFFVPIPKSFVAVFVVFLRLLAQPTACLARA